VAGAISAVSTLLPWRTDAPDAIQLLEADHRRLERLLEEGQATGPRAVKARGALLDTVKSELDLHELIEEKVFYPALQAHPEATDKVLEGYQEHHLADTIVGELRGMAADDGQWGAKFKVLQESIQHHIEEEEGAMFRTARAVLSSDELLDLGRRMADMKSAAQDAGRRSKSGGAAEVAARRNPKRRGTPARMKRGQS
jgi:hypothetical protein